MDHALANYNFRSSNTRLALPSLRVIDFGGTSRILIPMPIIPAHLPFDHLLHLGDLLRSQIIDLLLHLHIDMELIEIALLSNDDHVLRLDLRDLQEEALDLGGEDIDPADDEHVIAPAIDLVHFEEGSPAGALLSSKGRDVPGPVTNQGHGLALNGGEDQLTLCPYRKDLPGHGVDNFCKEMVFIEMEAVLLARSRIPCPVRRTRSIHSTPWP